MKYEIFNITRAWDKEKSESPTGIEPMTSRTPAGALSAELRELMESKAVLILAVCRTPVTYELSKMTLLS